MLLETKLERHLSKHLLFYLRHKFLFPIAFYTYRFSWCKHSHLLKRRKVKLVTNHFHSTTIVKNQFKSCCSIHWVESYNSILPYHHRFGGKLFFFLSYSRLTVSITVISIFAFRNEKHVSRGFVFLTDFHGFTWKKSFKSLICLNFDYYFWKTNLSIVKFWLCFDMIFIIMSKHI